MRKILGFVLTALLLSGMISVTYAQGDCPPSRLIPWQKGQVTPGLSNRVHEEPSLSSPLESTIPGNGVFLVYETGTCAEGYLWARILYDDKIGWTAEAQDSNYFVDLVAVPDGAIVVPAYINDVAWSSDGHTIALGTGAGVYLLDARLPTPIPTLLTQNAGDVEFSPTAPDILASSGGYGLLWVWDLAAKKVLYEVTESDPVDLARLNIVSGDLQFSSDGQLLFASGREGPDAYDTTTWQPVHSLQDYQFVTVTMSPNAQQFVVDPAQEKPYLSDWSGKRTPLDTGDLSDVILHVSFSPDSKMVAMNDNQGHVVRDILATGDSYTVTAAFDDDYHLMNGLTFSPDSSLLAIGDFTDQGGVLRLMNAATMQPIGMLMPDGVDQAQYFAFSPDASRIAAVFDNVLLIVNTADIHE